MHIVHFDGNNKIKSIRQQWDQGSLLKLVDVIGSRGRNWPICDGKDQARLIASTSNADDKASTSFQKAHQSTTADNDEVTITSKATAPRKNTGPTADPHASLSLFTPRDENTNDVDKPRAPRAGTRPEQRDYHDLFVGGESDASPASKAYVSPAKKENRPGAVAPKAGSNKNFQPNRLFEDDTPAPGTPGGESPQKLYKSNPKKYDHFDLGDGSDEPAKAQSKPSARPKSKHASNWGFEDFMTPAKHQPQKAHHQKPLQISLGDGDDDADAVPANERPIIARPRGQGKGTASNLYQNNLYDEDAEVPRSPDKKSNPLATATSLKDRQKDFDPHFEMRDESPGPASNKNGNARNAGISEPTKKVINNMNANWEHTDPNPRSRPIDTPAEEEQNTGVDTDASTSKDKENFSQGIKTTGDGMGAKKGSITAGMKNTGIKTGGDGMGGKKGAGRSWGFGDESDEDGVGGVNGGKFLAGKKQQAPKDDDFWNY